MGGGGGGVKSFSCKTQPVRLMLGWGFDNYFFQFLGGGVVVVVKSFLCKTQPLC